MIDVVFYANLMRASLRGSPFPDMEKAVSLLLGTAAQESHLTYTVQHGGGPARGLMQIETATEQSLWDDFLAYNPAIASWIFTRCGQTAPNEAARQYDMVYGVLLARTLYFWRDGAVLPAVEDVEEAARRWKTYYNTIHGAGTEEQYLANYDSYIAPYYPVPRG